MTVYGNENPYERLTEREQRVIKAIYDGKTYEEIACLEGIDLDRVKRIEAKAHKKLKD